MTATQFMLSGLLSASAACALAGEPSASELREMAIRYERALGVKQDYAEAYRLYCRAASLGDARSAYSIGWMYFDARGLPLKGDLALGWFQKAAAAGDSHAARLVKRFRGIKPADDPACPIRHRTLINNPNRKGIEALVNRIAPRYAIDPQLVLAVIQEESNFNPSALSLKKAQGLMQLIPATAQRFGVKDAWNPLENIRGGIAYLHWLMRHFAGNVKWVLAAYNAGEKAVEQYQGIPPFSETQNYVRHILATYPKTVHPVPPALRGEKLF
jgi:soluble lytic murein transglycosylase-like protein